MQMLKLNPTGTGLSLFNATVGTITNMNVNAEQLTATNNVSLTPKC